MRNYDDTLKIYKYCCTITLGVFMVTLGANLFVSNRASIQGKDLQSLFVEKSQLEKDISYLKYEDSSLSSLSFVQKRAAELGFVQMSEPLSTITSTPLASLTFEH